ncbi:MAG TPA: hypothetical protein VKT52_09950 [Ktedonobacterales bacterium]|nr:hypothetical protein [Ktedonobacterales bacterium]
MGSSRMPHNAMRWEYQDLVIPLAISVSHWHHRDYVGAATPRAQPIIQASLQQAASEGWRADEPTDFPTLFSRSRVRTRNNVARWRLDSVMIRLTRADSSAPLVPHG